MNRPDLASQAFKRAPHATLAGAVEAGPFCEVKLPVFGRVLATTRHAGSQALLKDTDHFAVDARNAGHRSAFGLPFLPKVFRDLANNVLSLDDPDHKRLRRLADGPFRRASIEAMRPLIREQVDRLLDAHFASGDADLVAGFCRRLPLQVIYTVLGMREETRTKFDVAMRAFNVGESPLAILRAVFALKPLLRTLREEIDDLRGAPRPGLMSDLVHAEQDGDQLSEDELVTMVFVLFVAGHETTTHLLSTSVFTLLTDPDALAQFRTLDGDALTVAVDELMRFTAPVQFTKPRFVREDMTFEGRELRKGDKVMALLAAGNLDPDAFEQPRVMDLARRPNRHLGWGGGPHICLGLHLAKAEAEIALSELFRRCPGLALMTAPDALKWIRRSGLRGLQTLPLALS
ncbi:cytochrome P450 [Hyphomonas johnsonii]|uniref:Cytochrome P450 family protein n=1 Tax=Hyphomonas johnsonii MHS-2 TaxID=1280950 RepID=A0A059FT14_9PROT|nr:cytochrome P450 [Hyphomonas johnsonii]KCZ93835.1 cytochrome P450 family protein [Hyphomonas johnsonii MHS-2]